MSLSNEVTQFNSNAQIITIVKGKFTLRCDENTEGAEPRELTKGDNKGKEVWELRYNSLTAKIKGGSLKTGDFGLNSYLEMEDPDSGDAYTVQLGSNSDTFRAFAQRLPNINLDEIVSIELVDSKKKGENGTPYKNLQVVQNGDKIADKFTEWKSVDGKNVRTNLYGMPAWENKRGTWSRDAQNEFLYDVFEKVFSGKELGLDDEPTPVEPEEPNGAPLEDGGDELPY